MKNTIILITLLLLLLPFTALSAPKAVLWEIWQTHDNKSSTTIDHSPWGEFLSRYLITDHPSGVYLVDYKGVTKADRQQLNEYLTQLQQTKVSGLNRNEQKAYWINLYNAQTIQLTLEHYPVRSIRNIDISPGLFSFGPWDAKLLTVEGNSLSLNDIEHRILRPIWQDNRVHYAVNCASIGCPNLQAEPFTAANLERLLEKAATDYINHSRGLKIRGKRLIVSSIFDWFHDDFGGSEQGVRSHLMQYANSEQKSLLNQKNLPLSYSYDWKLNEAK